MYCNSKINSNSFIIFIIVGGGSIVEGDFIEWLGSLLIIVLDVIC